MSVRNDWKDPNPTPTKEDLDFIVDDGSEDDDDEVVVEYEEGDEVDELLKGLSPEERALIEEQDRKPSGSTRRSTRKRKAPERYVDEKYLDLMLNKKGKVDLDELAELEKKDEENAVYIEEDSDDEFVADEDVESEEDDGSESEEEDEEDDE